MNDDKFVNLKVPRELAEQLDKIARDKGFSSRAPWAEFSRTVLKEAVKEAGE